MLLQMACNGDIRNHLPKPASSFTTAANVQVANNLTFGGTADFSIVPEAGDVGVRCENSRKPKVGRSTLECYPLANKTPSIRPSMPRALAISLRNIRLQL